MKNKTELLEFACDQGMEGLALHDPDGNFTYVNPAQAHMYGYEPKDLIGKSWRIFYSAEVARKIDAECFPELQSKGVWTGELVGQRRDKSQFDVEISLTRLTDDAGEYAGLVCNCRDITQRKQTEAHVRQLQRLESLAQLSAGVGHDFNNVMAIILGALELACLKVDDKDTLKLLQLAMDSTSQGSTVANRLLAFSTKRSLKPETVDVHELLNRLRPMLSAGLGDGVDLGIVCDHGVGTCVADPGELENAIINLALNGRDAMPDGGELTITATNESSMRGMDEHESNIVITVEDTGVGIDAVSLNRVFDPFFSTKPNNEGTGLGLSIVYGFAKQSGGSITAKSEVGVGSQFSLRLPGGPAEQTTQSSPPAFVPARKHQTIMLVEDDPSVRYVVNLQLRELGFRVKDIGTAEEAQSILRDEPIDLVLSDISLPGPQSGIDLAEHVRRHNGVKMVLMSGELNASIARGTSFIRKPFTVGELAEVLLEQGI
ncbi:MAG: ATP-binding protein [Pseudomonadota bacterium]